MALTECTCTTCTRSVLFSVEVRRLANTCTRCGGLSCGLDDEESRALRTKDINPVTTEDCARYSAARYGGGEKKKQESRQFRTRETRTTRFDERLNLFFFSFFFLDGAVYTCNEREVRGDDKIK